MVLGACAGQVPEPTTAQVAIAARTWPGLTRSRLIEGRTLYIDRCSGCHNLVPPGSRSRAQWAHDIAEMAGRAHLSQAEQDSVLRYLQSVTPSK